MKSILDEFYYGNISPVEQIISRDSDYWPLNHKISAEKEYFKSKLSQENIARFENMEEMFYLSAGMQEKSAFIYGFKLGVMFMVGVYGEGEEK